MLLSLFASIVISGRDWVVPVLAIALILGPLVVWSYRRSAVDPRLRMSCLGLRLLGVLALAFCLLEPVWVGQRAKRGANYFVVLADNSRGMQMRDPGDSRTRAEVMGELLSAGDRSWLGDLGEDFQLRRYYFDERLQATRDFSELDHEGKATALGSALRAIRERFGGQPLAGVLLLSDGNATDTVEGRVDSAGLPPIYPVLIGAEQSLRDVRVEGVSVSQTAFEDAPVTVQARVTATGYDGRRVVVQLRAPDGSLEQEQVQLVPARDESLTCRFQVRPGRSGLLLYEILARAEEDSAAGAAANISEATLVNNRRWVVVDRSGGPYRVLYVSGRPNWEFKFLNRGLAEDDKVAVVGLIRVARREPKFEFRGREGESSNPLYRGFDRTSEETERYDQPVLVRFNPRDAAELAGGFPKDAATLFGYDALVLDDVEAEFFTRDQMSHVQRFVSERGGGLLLLGGMESFRGGTYEHTPIGAVMPVYLDREPGLPAGEAFRFGLTREGWLEPWLRLRNSEPGEQSRLGMLPAVRVLNGARDLKPGASLLGVVTDSAGRAYPALAAQRLGLGRVATLLVGDLWRSGLRDQAAQADLQKWWRQWLRWLVAEVPRRVELHCVPKPEEGAAMRLQTRVRDAEYRPLDNATVSVSIRHLTNAVTGAAVGDAVATAPEVLRLTAEPSPEEPGLYETTYVPREDGAYVAQATAIDADGVGVGRAEAGWTAELSAEEFRSLGVNRGLMTSLAQATGGRVLRPGELDGFVRELPRRSAPIRELVSEPIWHRAGVFLFALACFISEWGLRRSKGMA